MINENHQPAAPEVLVVDDNPPTRYATARMLRAAGYRTREAGTGGEALEIADGSISAVILDVHLPDMNGLDVCRALRDRHDTSHLPVIHLSAAYVDNRDKVRGLNSGADAYMTHPADPDLLVATLNALIRVRTAEDGMRRSEARFHAIYDLAPNGMCLLDASGAFVDINPAMLSLLKREQVEVIGKRVIDFAPSGWVERAEEYLDKDQQGVWRGEFPMLDAAGQWVYLEWSLSTHVEPGLSIAIVNNISERVALSRQREELLEREQAARAASERISRSKDEFAAVLSHELRAPLNAITLWVEILKRGDAAANLERGLEVIDRNVKAQARLISDLLDVSRMAIGKLSLKFETFDAAELVKSAVHTLNASAREKSLDVSLDVAGVTRPVLADSTRLQQIVWNLLTNAIKFSKKGGRIQVGLRQDDTGLTLTVQDEGIGIKPEFQSSLFSTFSQSDSAANRRNEGLGLGLSIVKQLVELHGGTVQAVSGGPDLGAIFVVTLPARPPLANAMPSAPIRPEALETDPLQARSLAGLAIVVVDDDAEALAMLSMILRDRGASVICARDYTEALRCLEESPTDLLISDIGLPGKDGYDLIREVRRREGSSLQRLPAIALTAFARPEDRNIAFAAGFDAHCAKPLHPNELMSAILSVGAQERG